jgi:aminopeptidase-like protein
MLVSIDLPGAGKQMHELASELYPICRSITGDGVRKTLQTIKRTAPLEIHEVATGTPVFDWEVPREWNIRDAYIADSTGKRVVDFHNNSLHVLNYSIPVRKKLKQSGLAPHIFTLPDKPDLIPYKTSYYRENWGFCLSHRQWESLGDCEYEVVIDSSLEEGSLTYGELHLPGDLDQEFLFSTHICHPSLANDNLSGIVLMTRLAELLSGVERRFSYRFLFVPGTIGSITWLARNEANLGKVRFGLVTACVGDPGRFTYKKSRQENAEVDRVVQYVLERDQQQYSLRSFSPYGYDERQYCSPAFDLPVGHLSRTPHGQFDEYHTSADNLQFITPEALAGSLELFLKVVAEVENGRYYRNLSPKGEPQLGRRGLYSAMGGHRQSSDREMAMLWVLNLSDGHHATWDISRQSGLPQEMIEEVAEILRRHDLLEEMP